MREGGRAAETIAIGVPACTWVALAAAEWTGLPAAPTDPLTFVLALLAALALAFALGAATDRVADLLLDVWLGNGLRRRFLGGDDRYWGAYRALDAERRFAMAGLGRTRSLMRLCRGWSLNSLLLLAVFNAVAWSRPLVEALPRDHYLALHGGLTLAVALFAFASRRFLISELRRLRAATGS